MKGAVQEGDDDRVTRSLCFGFRFADEVYVRRESRDSVVDMER